MRLKTTNILLRAASRTTCYPFQPIPHHLTLSAKTSNAKVVVAYLLRVRNLARITTNLAKITTNPVTAKSLKKLKETPNIAT